MAAEPLAALAVGEAVEPEVWEVVVGEVQLWVAVEEV